MYGIEIEPRAQKGLEKLKRSEPLAFRKAVRLLKELAEHPRTGTGHPEPLSGDRAGQWSRQITKNHRLVFEIRDTEVLVLVLTAYGHYDDK
ncbi:MAG: Txe/YoeB family addiction module toxin [Muribaculaceae bacterium]|nr:Txe/YoeB family addiction module toxin [Muribaculaceae bacterium]